MVLGEAPTRAMREELIHCHVARLAALPLASPAPHTAVVARRSPRIPGACHSCPAVAAFQAGAALRPCSQECERRTSLDDTAQAATYR